MIRHLMCFTPKCQYVSFSEWMQ